MSCKHVFSWLALALMLLVPAQAWAGHGAPRPDASLVVTGTIEVTPGGDVAGYQLDQPAKLPHGITKLLGSTIPGWKFEPPQADKPDAIARAHMQLRLLATPNANGSYTVRVASAWFGTPKGRADDPRVLSYKHRQAPRYPIALVRARFSGIVELIVRIDRTGNVDKVGVLRVDLTTRGSTIAMRHARQMFAEAASDAAPHWTFKVPTAGPNANRDHWIAAIPVTFRLRGPHRARPKYGQWVAFLPGTKHLIPWLHDDAKRALANASALTSGVHLLDAPQRLHLRAPANGG